MGFVKSNYLFAICIGSILSGSFKAEAQIPRQPPAGYTVNTAVNYIRTWDAAAPVSDVNQLTSREVRDVKVATQYFDGLGRPLQTVVKQGSLETGTSPTDIVSPVEYDAFGREQYKWLPYAAGSTDGAFKLSPFTESISFYSNPIGVLKNQNENFFYSETVFEASPFDRATKSMAAGVSWTGSGRGLEQKYWFNTTVDDVKIWSVLDNPFSMGSYSLNTTVSANGSYGAGLLSKSVTVDEHGKQVIEFKDKTGLVILKKVQLTATADNGSGSSYNGWLSTYYIYDDFGRLRCVVQPEGVNTLASSNWLIGAVVAVAGEQCFFYEYDSRGRMIVKKVPGADPVYMVYDKRDRLVMTQDGNMRIGSPVKWLVTLYDEFNRPIQTGLWNNSGTRSSHAQAAAVSSNYFYPFSVSTVPGSGWEKLSASYYDDYAGLPSPLTSTLITTWDSYFNAPSGSYPYSQPITASSKTKGKATWSETKVLGTVSQFITTVMIYDEKGRVIQLKTVNKTGGIDVMTTQYSWVGQPLVIITKSQKSGAGQQETVIVTQNSYDDLGRLVKVEKKQGNSLISGGSMSAYKTIVKNDYDKLGQLKKKEIGTNPATSAALETLNYDYNIRGWMLGVNRSYLNLSGQSGTTRFGFELGYDKTDNAAGNSYASPQYNGNISGMTWKSDGDDVRRKYDFSYDAANRLMKGEFKQDNGGTTWNNSQMNYNMQMGNGTDPLSAYDANGNIKGMIQYGWKLGGSTSTPIDNLVYNYYDNSNRLKNVIDANNDPLTKLGDFRTSTLHTQSKNVNTVDYTYDQNGNLKKDLNKDIGTATAEDIIYNYLNLPQSITVRTTGGAIKGTITYTYDAAGNKLQKTVTETGQPSKTTLYIGGAVYENDVLQFFGHEEGRMRPGTTGFNYDYMIKDHLGNVRMVLSEEQKQDIYPAATLEGSTTAGALSMINEEKKYYTIDNTKIVNKPWTNTGFDYPNNNGTPPGNLSYPGGTTPTATATSSKVYQLNATTNTMANKTGLGVVIKVMAGDAINIFGRSYHKKPTSGGGYSGTTNSLAVLDILNAFVGTGIVAGKGVSGSQVTGQTGFPTTMTGLIGNQPAQEANRPKAAINWIVLDEQFKWVSGGFDMVGSASNTNGINNTYTTVDGTRKVHDLSTIPTINVPKNGYIYVWASNESKFNVFFDNLQVVHTRGAILEETHYSPFGLIMSGLSSKALAFGTPENKLKYNGKEEQKAEFSDGSGLDWLDYGARMYDAQIGRWHVVDPLCELGRRWSTYKYGMDNPLKFIDPDGMWEEKGGGMYTNDPTEIKDYLTTIKNRSSNRSDKKKDKDATEEEVEPNQQSPIITKEAKFFENETNAYNYMWENSIDENTTDKSLEFRENCGIIVNDGVIVLPNYKNNYNTGKFKEVINIKENEKGHWTHVQFNGKWYAIKGFVHTHSHAGDTPDQAGVRMPSDEDVRMAKQKFPGLPGFVISRVETFIYFGDNRYKEISSSSKVLSGAVKLSKYTKK